MSGLHGRSGATFTPHGRGRGFLQGTALATSVVVPYATNYPFGGGPRTYNAYAVLFADLTGKVKGVDYDANWTINPSQFPNNSKLDWYVPKGTPSTGVWGYEHIDFNPNNNAPLSSITALTTTFDWSYTGSVNFNLLVEFWIARGVDAPAYTTDQSVSNAAYFEIGLFLHCPDYSFHNGGTLIGTTHVNNGVSYTCRQNARYITFAQVSQTDKLTGAFDWVAALNFLVFNGIISGSEWLSGYAPFFGIEPTALAGTGTHGGTINFNTLSTTYAANAGAQSADYLGTDGFADGNTMTNWTTTGLAAAVAAADMDGGTAAAVLLETTGAAGSHDFIKQGAYSTVDSREMDYILFEDFKADKGRTKFQQYLANGNGGTAFGHQLKSGFDTVAMTAVDDLGGAVGNLLTLLNPGRQIINMGGGWYRAITAFRKAAGVTQLFYDFIIKDASGATSYVGDITKGVTMRVRHRLPALSKITISGTPPAATTGVAYSFVPTVRGGKSPIVYSGVSMTSGWAVNSSTGELTSSSPATGTATNTIRATGNDGTVTDYPISVVVTALPVDPYDTVGAAAGVTFSEANRRITNTAGNLGAKSTLAKSAGKLHSEVNIVASTAGTIGVGNASVILNNWMSQNANGLGLDTSSGDVYTNGTKVSASGLGSLAVGSTVLIEEDYTARTVTFGKVVSGVTTWSAVAYTMPTGNLYIASQPSNGSHRIATENAQFVATPRSGVSARN